MFLESILLPDIPNRVYFGLFLVLTLYGSSITLIRSILLFLGNDNESLSSFRNSFLVMMLGVIGLAYQTFTHNIPGLLSIIMTVLLIYGMCTLILTVELYRLKKSKKHRYAPVSCVSSMSVSPLSVGVAVMHYGEGVATREVPILNISDRTLFPGETLFFKNERSSLVLVSYKKEDVQ